jgi:hypothetical protein
LSSFASHAVGFTTEQVGTSASGTDGGFRRRLDLRSYATRISDEIAAIHLESYGEAVESIETHIADVLSGFHPSAGGSSPSSLLEAADVLKPQ